MQGGRKGHEVRNVLIVWVLLFLVISAVSVALLVYSSISLLNRKTAALKADVVEQTADYYLNAFDSTLDFVQTNPGVLVGQELWDPDPEAPIDREQTLERMRVLLKISFNADYVAYVTDGEVRYSTAYDGGLPGLPEAYADGYRVIHDLKQGGDTYLALCKHTDYPFIGPEDQFIYTLVDITRQTDAITALYENSRSQLLWSQLIVGLILLLLSIILAPLGIAWAVRRYVAAPILELDKLSQGVMDGSLQEEVEVDEESSFADMQRLLRGAQDVLKQMDL
jgi:hypothetical protein